MSNKDGYSVAERYRTLRKHLDNLGYKQALSLDSLPLIELLLVDLIQTKETLKHYESIAKDNLDACSELKDVIEPYKCDNAKLVQECNQLHIELIEAKELNHKQNVESKKKIRRLESELNNLQLSFSKNIERIKQLEIESAEKTKKVLELQGKCCKPVVHNTNLTVKRRACFPLRKPTLEADPLPRTSSCNSEVFSTKNVEPYIVNFVSLADHRISSLNNEVTKLKEELFISNETIESLKSQLTTKYSEMSRLRKLLEGGRPCTSINKDHACNKFDLASNKDISKSSELLLMQREKENLESQLKEALNKQHEAISNALKLAERNEELERELKEIDRMTVSVEADCNSVIKHNNKKVSKMQQKLDSVMTQVNSLKHELTTQRRETQELRADLEACRFEKSSIQRLLDSTLEEKKQMTDKINLLTSIASKSDVTHCHRETVTENTYCSSKIIHEKDVIIESLQHTIERLEKERDHYKEEIYRTRAGDKRDFEKDHEGAWPQIHNLKSQLNEKENIISKLVREKKQIYQEKVELENKLQCVQYQKNSNCIHGFSRSHSDLCRPPCDYTDPNNQFIIERLQREKDSLKADIDRLVEERDAMRERLKLATEAHVCEQRRLREIIADLEVRFKRNDRDRHELIYGQETKKATIQGLEDQVNDLKKELRRNKDELSEQRSQYLQLRALHDQTDQALCDLQAQLTRAEGELTTEMDRNKCLERQLMQLDCQTKDLKQEINNYRMKISQLDRDKDEVILLLDEKTERVAALERELMFKEQQASGISNQIQDIQFTKQEAMDRCADLERQNKKLQGEIGVLKQQLLCTNQQRDLAEEQVGQLQRELAEFSCQYRSLQKDYEQSTKQAEDLKRQLQTYVTEVRKAEKKLEHKESERNELLKHLHDLNNETLALENSKESIEAENSEAKCKLQSARCKIKELEDFLMERECLTVQYERKNIEMSHEIASLEHKLRCEQERHQMVEQELQNANEVIISLQKQLQCLNNSVDDDAGTRAKLEEQLEQYKSEQKLLTEHHNRDHMARAELEKLLEEVRHESTELEIENEKLKRELAQWKAKTEELNRKLCESTREMRAIQEQAADYSKKIEQLQMELTNEKFNHVRHCEENSRTNDCGNRLLPSTGIEAITTRTALSDRTNNGCAKNVRETNRCPMHDEPYFEDEGVCTNENVPSANEFCTTCQEDNVGQVIASKTINGTSYLVQANDCNLRVQVHGPCTQCNSIHSTVLIPRLQPVDSSKQSVPDINKCCHAQDDPVAVEQQSSGRSPDRPNESKKSSAADDSGVSCSPLWLEETLEMINDILGERIRDSNVEPSGTKRTLASLRQASVVSDVGKKERGNPINESRSRRSLETLATKQISEDNGRHLEDAHKSKNSAICEDKTPELHNELDELPENAKLILLKFVSEFEEAKERVQKNFRILEHSIRRDSFNLDISQDTTANERSSTINISQLDSISSCDSKCADSVTGIGSLLDSKLSLDSTPQRNKFGKPPIHKITKNKSIAKSPRGENQQLKENEARHGQKHAIKVSTEHPIENKVIDDSLKSLPEGNLDKSTLTDLREYEAVSSDEAPSKRVPVQSWKSRRNFMNEESFQSLPAGNLDQPTITNLREYEAQSSDESRAKRMTVQTSKSRKNLMQDESFKSISGGYLDRSTKTDLREYEAQSSDESQGRRQAVKTSQSHRNLIQDESFKSIPEENLNQSTKTNLREYEARASNESDVPKERPQKSLQAVRIGEESFKSLVEEQVDQKFGQNSLRGREVGGLNEPSKHKSINNANYKNLETPASNLMQRSRDETIISPQFPQDDSSSKESAISRLKRHIRGSKSSGSTELSLDSTRIVAASTPSRSRKTFPPSTNLISLNDSTKGATTVPNRSPTRISIQRAATSMSAATTKKTTINSEAEINSFRDKSRIRTRTAANQARRKRSLRQILDEMQKRRKTLPDKEQTVEKPNLASLDETEYMKLPSPKKGAKLEVMIDESLLDQTEYRDLPLPVRSRKLIDDSILDSTQYISLPPAMPNQFVESNKSSSISVNPIEKNVNDPKSPRTLHHSRTIKRSPFHPKISRDPISRKNANRPESVDMGAGSVQNEVQYRVKETRKGLQRMEDVISSVREQLEGQDQTIS